MIDFRYHLVSIVGIFLALAVGIALGAGPLKDPVDVALGNQTEALREERNQLRNQVDDLDARVAYDDAWASAASNPLVAGRLANQRVVIVRLPETDAAAADAARGSLEAGGATISGVVALTDSWSDPDQEAVLDDLVTRLSPATESDDDEDASPYERAGQVLGDALVTSELSQVGVPSEGSSALLSALVELDVIEVTGAPEERASFAMVLAPPAPEDPDSDDASRLRSSVLPLISALDSGAGEVVGGPEGSAADGSVVRAVRDDGDLRSSVSTVDIVDVPSGRASALVALAQQGDGLTGHYGDGPGVDGAAPDFERRGGP